MSQGQLIATDQMAPAVATARRAREALAPVRTAHRDVATPTDVRRLVVIVSSSRGGSTLLHLLLRLTGAFCFLPGEHTPLYKLFGLNETRTDDWHDGSIDRANADLDGFTRALLEDLAVADGQVTGGEELVHSVTERLFSQWHQALPALPVVSEHVRTAIDRVAHTPETVSPEDILFGILDALREAGTPIDPWYYDVDPARIRAAFPTLSRPSAPPPLDSVVEAPPFVVPAAFSPATARDVRDRPVLLKASVDAYRLELLRELFPAARLTVVHQVRNPAAAVNGLIDGWLHRGFFSHRLGDSSPLNIDGYSHLPWGRQWWNFDLPPGWADVADRPLPEVCAHQWCAAHQAILADARVADDYVRVRAEDLMAGSTQRLDAVGRVMGELGLTATPVPMRPERFVMMTVRPRPGRWRARGSRLRPVLETPAVRSMAERLGYQTSSGWI